MLIIGYYLGKLLIFDKGKTWTKVLLLSENLLLINFKIIINKSARINCQS